MKLSRTRANRGCKDLVRLLRDAEIDPEQMPDEAFERIDEFERDQERERERSDRDAERRLE